MAAVGRFPPIKCTNLDRKNPRKCFGSYASRWADLPGTTQAACIPRRAFFQACGLSPDICPCGWADHWLTYVTFLSHLLQQPEMPYRSSTHVDCLTSLGDERVPQSANNVALWSGTGPVHAWPRPGSCLELLEPEQPEDSESAEAGREIA